MVSFDNFFVICLNGVHLEPRTVVRTGTGRPWLPYLTPVWDQRIRERVKDRFTVDLYQDCLPASPEVSPLVLSDNADGESRIEVTHVTADLSSFVPLPNQQTVPNLTKKY